MHHHKPDADEPPPEAARARAARQAAALAEAVRLAETAVASRQPVDETLSRYFRSRPELGARDRRIISGCVFALWRWRGWCGPPTERIGAVLAIAHRLECGAEPLPAALHHLPGFAAPPPPPPDGFQGLEDRRQWVSNHWKPDARPEDLVPAWALDALALPDDPTPGATPLRWLETIQRRPPLWLRAADGDGAALARRLTALGHPAETPLPRLPAAVRVPRPIPIAELEKTVGPVFEIQDAASQAVGAWCDPRPGEEWWDACVGAGGKALDLAARTRGRAKILGSDVRPAALGEARRRIRRLGLSGIRLTLHDARQPLPGSPQFHGVLVDAPCTGLGTWGRAPDARWRAAPEDLAASAALQRELLRAASAAVRAGGRLVYAVCSLTRAETLEITSWFEREHPRFEREPGLHPLQSGGGPEPAMWVWPWMGPGTGMYAVRWRRIR
ncbi:MAG: RsmB/NOP family class I SAM-dependent RNA methyltransferase [Kiritimatiellae bacterium]|nr:RsmB/NOP family class I SAM-dependent RNA methyltransferase [Kiritimatiellia bacterium]